MQDKRLVTRLQNYWELIRRGKEMPEIQQLNPSSLDDMWQQCMQLAVLPMQGGIAYQYVFMGRQLVQMYGRDLSSQMVNPNASEYPLNIVVKKLGEVMQTRQFLMDENQFINSGGRVVKYRACFMPFGNDTRGITHIVVGFSGREF